MLRTTLSIALAAALAASAGSALALSAADQKTVSTTVRYGDLNLANPQDAKVMLARIKHAANRVCDDPTPESFLDYPDWENCISKATNSAVSRLNAPMVTAAYSGKQANSVVLAQNSPR